MGRAVCTEVGQGAERQRWERETAHSKARSGEASGGQSLKPMAGGEGLAD